MAITATKKDRATNHTRQKALPFLVAKPLKTMKITRALRYVIGILFFLIKIYATAQPGIIWEKSLGGTGIDKGMSIAQTNDNGFILAGYSSSIDGTISSSIVEKYWVAKLSNSGTLEWEKSYSLGNGADSTKCTIKETTDGGYILAAASSNSSVGETDFWIVKLDINGDIQWDANFGGSSYEKPFSIQQIDDGYIVAGYATSVDGDVSFNYFNADCWIIKIDTAGNLIWDKPLGGYGYDKFYSIEQTNDGGFIALGTTTSTTGSGDVSFNHGGGDLWVVKLDSTGNTTWEKCYGGSSGEGFWLEKMEITQTIDGGFVMVTNTSSTDGDISVNDGGNDAWVVKIDPTGQIEWEKTFGGSMVDYLNSVVQLPDGTYVVSGHTLSWDGDVSSNYGGFDFWLLRLNSSGTILWEQNYGGTGYEEVYGLEKTSDGGLILIGSTNSSDGDISFYHGGAEDMWIVKLNNMLSTNQNFDASPLSVVNPIDQNLAISSSEFIEEINIRLYNSSGQLLLRQESSISEQLILDIKLSTGLYYLEIDSDYSNDIFKLIKI